MAEGDKYITEARMHMSAEQLIRGLIVEDESGRPMLSSSVGSAPLPGFDFRRNITLDNTGNPEGLEDQQILVQLNSSNFSFANAQSNGEDLRFTLTNNTLLDYWIQSYDDGAETASIYVKIPSCSAFGTKTIYLYYGNALASAVSSWNDTMHRASVSTSGGDTLYLLNFNETSGATLTNSGSVGGTLAVAGTAPSWNANNIYGHSGGSMNFNGTNNAISINGLFNTWPSAFKIYFQIKSTAITGNPRLCSKFNALSGTAPLYGNFFDCYIDSATAKLKVRYNQGSADVFSLTSTTSIVNGTKYAITLVVKNQAIGLYINGVLESRSKFVSSNGSEGAFKIGCFSDITSGVSNSFFNGVIQDFEVTDYTSGEEPRLPQIEAEHSNVKFYQKDKRTKFAAERFLVDTNFPTGTISDYRAEPFGIFHQGYHRIFYSHGDGVLRMKKSLTSEGLAAAVAVGVYGNGTGGEAGAVHLHSLTEDSGLLYLFYAIGSTGPIYCVVSSDGGETWASKVTALAKPAVGFGSVGLVNTSVIKSGSTYYMLVEVKLSGTPQWKIGLSDSSTITGPYTDPVAIEDFAQMVDGTAGGPSIIRGTNIFHIVYHAQSGSIAVSAADQVYYASTDFSTFTVSSSPVGRIPDELLAFDQFADATISSYDGKTYLDYAGMDNRTPFFGSILRATFHGTVDQWARDFSYSVGTETLI